MKKQNAALDVVNVISTHGPQPNEEFVPETRRQPKMPLPVVFSR